MRLDALGDSAVVATLGTGIDPATVSSVRRLASAIASARIAGITDIVPAYASVTVFYDPHAFESSPGSDPFPALCAAIEACARHAAPGDADGHSRLVEVPVCYGGALGPDLESVAEGAGLSPEEAVRLHCEPEYLVHAIGFMPGFPYLGGLPATLRTPRRGTPRTSVPAGSVAIGGAQTGIYPVSSPGGWNLIGRTPLPLFRPSGSPASLLRPGDRVRFRPIPLSEFETWK